MKDQILWRAILRVPNSLDALAVATWCYDLTTKTASFRTVSRFPVDILVTGPRQDVSRSPDENG